MSIESTDVSGLPKSVCALYPSHPVLILQFWHWQLGMLYSTVIELTSKSIVISIIILRAIMITKSAVRSKIPASSKIGTAIGCSSRTSTNTWCQSHCKSVYCDRIIDTAWQRRRITEKHSTHNDITQQLARWQVSCKPPMRRDTQLVQ